MNNLLTGGRNRLGQRLIIHTVSTTIATIRAFVQNTNGFLVPFKKVSLDRGNG
jgi:hypothetical protein